MSQHRILVVDDEPTLCDTLRFNLEIEGYAVDTAYSAEQALTMPVGDYSLILLDVMMGETSGFDMARALRRDPATASVPIIFVTARGAEDDMVAGLNLGADDYIAKPYSIRNVLARVRTVLRRTARQAGDAGPAEGETVFEGLRVNTVLKRCTVDGETVRLPRKEFEILALLLANPGKIYSRADILRLIRPDDVVVLERVVDVNVTRLRSKIGRYGRHIVTRSGYGYGFEA